MVNDEPSELYGIAIMPAGIGGMIAFDAPISGGGYVTPSLIQSAYSASNSASFTSNQTVGNLNVVFVICQGGKTGYSATVTDTIGNTYSYYGTNVIPAAQNMTVIFYCQSIKATTTTNVVTVGSGGSYVIYVAEFAGGVWSSDTGVINGTNGDGGGSSWAFTSTSLTTATAGELVVGFIWASGGTIVTPSGWSVVFAPGNTYETDYKVPAGAGSISYIPTGSWGGVSTSIWIAVGAWKP